MKLHQISRNTLLRGGHYCIAGPFRLPEESEELTSICKQLKSKHFAVGPYMPNAHLPQAQRTDSEDTSLWGVYREKKECLLSETYDENSAGD